MVDRQGMLMNYKNLANLLLDIEAELKQLQLWQTNRPSDKALASTEPFCIDTLSLPQWLQFIFLERMTNLISQKRALPAQCGVAPLAAEFFKGHSGNGLQLINLLQRLDALLSEQKS